MPIRLRMQAIGTGATNDPVRVDMPTWSFVAYDPVTHLMTVEIPDDDAPSGLPNPGSQTYPITAYGPILTQMPPGITQSWTDKLRKRYPDKGNNWNPPNVL